MAQRFKIYYFLKLFSTYAILENKKKLFPAAQPLIPSVTLLQYSLRIPHRQNKRIKSRY
jgi:hypothetical protein